MKLPKFLAASMRDAPDSIINAKPDDDEGWRAIAKEVWERGGSPPEVAEIWWARKRERAKAPTTPPPASTPQQPKDPRAFFCLVFSDDSSSAPLARAPRPLDDELFPARSLITGTKARPPLQAKSEWPCRYCKKSTQSSDRACRRPACERSRESHRVE